MTRTGRQRRTGSAFEILPLTLPGATQVLAVDPGAVHCGMARMEVGRSGWVGVQAWKVGPMQCLESVSDWIRGPWAGVLVVEGFRLYPTMLQEQGLSSLGVVEVIGALKWLYLTQAIRDPAFRQVKGFVEQGASIKAAGRRYMERIGVEPIGANIHARDAEAHGWYQIRKLLGD